MRESRRRACTATAINFLTPVFPFQLLEHFLLFVVLPFHLLDHFVIFCFSNTPVLPFQLLDHFL